MAEPAPARFPETNFVIVKIDPRFEKLAEPEPFHLCKKRHEQIKWEAADSIACFTVDFGHDSPFHYTQFSTNYPLSGEVRREVLGDSGKYYKYTVRIEVGGEIRTVDPGGVVNP